LKSDQKWTYTQISAYVDLSERTINRRIERYEEHGIEGALYDNVRSGQPKRLDDTAEAHLVALACSDPPEGRAVWTLELLAQRMITDKKVKKISGMCIRRYLTNRGIKPWLEKNVVYS